MDKLHEKKIKDIIHNVGLNNNLLDSDVRKIVESQFKLSYDTIKKLSLLDEIPDEKTNFYFKYIGKLYMDKYIVNNYKKRNNKNEEESNK